MKKTLIGVAVAGALAYIAWKAYRKVTATSAAAPNPTANSPYPIVPQMNAYSAADMGINK